MTVQELRKKGYKVQIRHIRNHDLIIDEETMSVVKEVSNKGGRTEIWITSPAGKDGRGIARCCKKDSYRRKLGVTIALGKALKELGE